MKQTIILLLLCLFGFGTKANSVDDGKISYLPIITGNGIPAQARESLSAKMEQAISQNGFGASSHTDRFVMLAKCNVLEKDVAPTTPPRITQTVEVTFILGDVIENKTYASASFELKGIGTNEAKAWQTALNGLKSGNPRFKTMFEEARGKIEAYYSANCKKLITEAQALASTGEYDRAIHQLMSVPDVCTDCRNEVLAEATALYQQKIDAEGAALLAKAKNTWAMSQDAEGAEIAMAYLCTVSPTSASFGPAEELVKKIADKISSDNEREWKQRLKEYNDEKEFRRREQENTHARTMANIAACRSVAEKWAENQPQNNVYLNW